MTDPVRELAHDHADLNRRVLALSALVLRRDPHAAKELVAPLADLRELLFLHFAREEEGLFPFVAECVPELAERVHGMALAHDGICGALARMVHMAAAGAEVSGIAALYERFEAAYSRHAQTEAELLQTIDARLDADQRARLAALVRGL